MGVEAPVGLLVRDGERWRNWTGRPWYQLVSSLRHPCGVCLHDMAGCCRGGGASPCILIASARRSRYRRAAMPRSRRGRCGSWCYSWTGRDAQKVSAAQENLRLLGHDLVTYPQLFDEWGDPLPFERVVKSAGLKLEQLTGTGVLEPLARSVLGL